MGTLIVILDLLREMQADRDAILAEADFPLAAFRNPDNLVPVAASVRLVATCARRTGCPHFGLLIGQRGDLAKFGRFGFLLRSEPDIATALTSIVAYMSLTNRMVVPGVIERHGAVELSLLAYNANVPDSEFIHDVIVSLAHAVLRDLCGPGWLAQEVLLSRHPPADLTPYRQLFRCTVRFDAEFSGIIFPAHWMKRAIPTANAELRRIMAEDLGIDAPGPGTSLADDVRRLLRVMLARGDGSVETTARHLSLHPRTLHRGLADQGTSFRALLDEVKCDLASHLLRNTATPLSHVASMTGYADATAFSRAFRRWTGHAPSDWRRSVPVLSKAGGEEAEA